MLFNTDRYRSRGVTFEIHLAVAFAGSLNETRFVLFPIAIRKGKIRVRLPEISKKIIAIDI